MIFIDSQPQPILQPRWRSPVQVKASDSTLLSATTTTCCQSPGTTSELSSLSPGLHSHSTTKPKCMICWAFCHLAARDSAIAFSDRIKSGVVGDQLWLQITEPTEKDTGKYAIEFSDGKGGVRRTVELSGQGEHHRRSKKLELLERTWCCKTDLKINGYLLSVFLCSIRWCLCRIPEAQVSNCIK